MKRHISCLLLIATFFIGGAHAAQADHVKASHAWIRLLPGDLPASGYVTLKNDNSQAAVLVNVHSTSYASAMIHQSTLQPNGMSRMVMVQRVEIPAHGTVSLAPAGYHLMFERAALAPKPGDIIEITLDFADGSHLPVPFMARPANAVGPDQ